MPSAVIVTESWTEFQECCKNLLIIKKYKDIHMFSPDYSIFTEISNIDCDLLLLGADIHEENQIELADRLLKLKPDLKLVIIADSDRVALEALQIGVFEYMVKPVTPEQTINLKNKLQRISSRME